MKLKNVLKGIILGTLMPLAILTGAFLAEDLQRIVEDNFKLESKDD